MTSSIDIVPESEVSGSDREFVRQWSKTYFDEDVAEHGLTEARVDWRLFLRADGETVSHVALTDLVVEIDGQQQILGAVGGLFTIVGFEGRGFANKLMDAVELFANESRGRALAILFCLKDLVPFYARRGWLLVESDVTIQQVDKAVVWPESVMVLPSPGVAWNGHTIHIPN